MAAQPSRRWEEPDVEPDVEPAVGYGREPDFGTATPGERPEGRPWTTGSFILAVVAVFFLPFFAGLAGAIVGWIGLRKGDRLARWAIGANTVIVVLSLIAALTLTTTGS